MFMDELASYAGISKLRNPEIAAQLKVFYGEFVDVSVETKRDLQSTKALSEHVVSFFWKEFSAGLKLMPVKARLAFGLPESVDDAADCFFDLGHLIKKRTDLKTLLAMPSGVDGTQRGIFDDVCFFDIPLDMIVNGVIDLTPIERFLTSGTTVSFYLPAPHHMRWYTYAKKHTFPIQIRCTKKLSPIFDKPISDNVHSIVFGIGQPSRSEGPPTSSTNSTATVGLGTGAGGTAASLGVPTNSEGRPLIGTKSEST